MFKLFRFLFNKKIKTDKIHDSYILNYTEVKEILNDNLTPKLLELGFVNYDSKYVWTNNYNELGIKKIIEFGLLKGASGEFYFGYNFNFIPRLNNLGKIYKSKSQNQLHLFERSDIFHNCESRNEIAKIKMSYIKGRDHFKKTLDERFNIDKDYILNWFESYNSFDKCIERCIYQLESKCWYTHDPDQKYILAFLYAKTNQKEKGLILLKEFYKPYLEKDQDLLKELNKLETKLMAL